MKLVRGVGSPEVGACWMSAIHWYMLSGKEGFKWSDHPGCVDPVIRSLCILLNDRCSDGEREALIGPHLFTPVGTMVSRELTHQRVYLVADRAVRVYAPAALDAMGLTKEAADLRGLPPIVDALSSGVAKKAAERAAREALLQAGVEAGAAAESVRAAAVAVEWATEWGAGAAAEWAVMAVGVRAAETAAKRDIVALILDLCAMGHTEETTCKTQRETVEYVTAICRR